MGGREGETTIDAQSVLYAERHNTQVPSPLRVFRDE